MNDLSLQEAREALDLIDETTRRMRRSLAHGGGPYFLIIWGLVWVIGFSGAHFFGPEDARTGWTWMVVNSVGVVASFALGWWMSRRVRSRERGGERVALFWLAWMLYASLIITFARPQIGNQLSILISLFAMMGYVTTGILYRSVFISLLGLIITALIVIGYLALPMFFNLWMAVLGGGSLIAAGVYVLRSWR